MKIFDPPDEEKIDVASELYSIAQTHSISLVSCCYPLLHEAGLKMGHCVDPILIGQLRPDLTLLNLKPKASRKGCGCFESTDIGVYDTCCGACIYCYATQSLETAQKRANLHRPDSDMIC